MRLVVTTSRTGEWKEFMETLRQQQGVELLLAEDGEQALAMVRDNGPFAVLIDADLSGMEPLALVAEVLRTNAMVHCVVGSALADDDFHEASEGLGVAARIPPNPKADDARMMLNTLRDLGG